MLHVLRTVEAMTMPLHQPEKCHSSQNIIAITIMVVKISGIIYICGRIFHTLGLVNRTA